MTVAHGTTAHRATALDRLRQLASGEPPFLSVVSVLDGRAATAADRLDRHRAALTAAGAGEVALEALSSVVDAHLEAEAGALYTCVDAAGRREAQVLEEGPMVDFVQVSSLPYAAPLVEWEQWEVTHLVVTATRQGYEIVPFAGDPHDQIVRVSSVDAAVGACRDLCEVLGVELIVVAGDAGASAELRDHLVGHVPVTASVVVVTPEEVAREGGLAESVVRRVADHVARRTVRWLQDFRFLLVSDGAAQGAEATLAGLRRGWGDALLVHDDPDDDRQGWFRRVDGGVGHEVALAPEGPGWEEARLVDVAIHAAAAGGYRVRILPMTGEGGPDEGLALVDTALVSPPDEVEGLSS